MKKKPHNRSRFALATTTSMSLVVVMDALHEKGRIPADPPCVGLPPQFHRDNLQDLYVEKRNGGWVANISFCNVPAGLPNTIGTPDARPFPSKRQAFLAGAELVCGIVTGSTELPFFDLGDAWAMVITGPARPRA